MVEKGRPSLDAQIEEAQAPKGSVLERIIKENQDFDLLAPEEPDDEFSYPLWLRVWWRKQHPEVQLPPTNPGAAYPEVLSAINKRMKANPDLPWGDQEKMNDVLKDRAGSSGN